MGSEEGLRPELRSVLETYRAIRNSYEATRAQNGAQAEKLAAAETEVAKLTENLGKATKAYLTLEKRHAIAMEEMEKEKNELRDSLKQLQEHFDHLRVVNVDRNIEQQQSHRLEEEVEILKSQLALQEERYKEEITLLKRKYAEETKNYKMQLDNAKVKNTLKNSGSKPCRGHGGPKRGFKKSTSCFRWPSLDITNNTEVQAQDKTTDEDTVKTVKKRKLFREEHEKLIDIV